MAVKLDRQGHLAVLWQNSLLPTVRTIVRERLGCPKAGYRSALIQSLLEVPTDLQFGTVGLSSAGTRVRRNQQHSQQPTNTGGYDPEYRLLKGSHALERTTTW